MGFERISLNIIPDGEMPVFHVSQFDVGRPIIIDLYNGDDAYTPAAGVTFELHCRKVDDNIVTLDSYEVDGNTVTFASTEQLCACSGDNLCEVAIMLDDLLMGTLNFILHVERDPLAGGLTSETSIYNLTQQIDDIITGEGYVKDTDLDVLQSDWVETDPTSPAYIKNKPGPSLVDQADWTETDPTKQSYIKHKPDLKTVATTGSYNDLTDKPTIPDAQIQSDWNEADNTKVDYIKNKPDLSIYAQSSDLAAVATSGDYDDLLNKPTIPAAQVNSDWNSNSGVSQILNKPYVPVYTENETPYQIRTAPAGNNRCLEKLVGVSCAFNQLIQNGNFADTSNWSTVDATFAVSDNVGTYTRTATGDILGYYSFPTSLNHKYICSFDCRSSAGGVVEVSNIIDVGSINVVANTWTKFSKIGIGAGDATAALRINADGGVGDTLDLRNFNIIDLTACFGSEVADYLYNLENG